MHWQTTRFQIDLRSPQVMGIVNVTPDSFSDGGLHAGMRQAIARCEQLVGEGADLLDIGGESTRPGASPVPVGVELARVVPVLRAAVGLGVPISVDTSKAEVMRAALDLGVDIVNDVHALRLSGTLEAVSDHPGCGVCLMHMNGTPETMQRRPLHDDVVAEVISFLRDRTLRLQERGIERARMAIDPGIGFGKSVAHNIELLRRQRELLVLGLPILVGWSRKSTLGAITGRDVGDRLAASVAAALMAVCGGARIVRVHDVAATVDALKVWRAAEPQNR